MEDCVCIELFDFHQKRDDHLEKNYDSEILMEKFRNKLKPRTRFSWESFEIASEIDFKMYGKPKNVQICYEYGLLLINVKDRILVFDLKNRSFIRCILFKYYIAWFCVRGFEMYISSLGHVSKFNIKLLLADEEAIIVDNNHKGLIWSYSKTFDNVWGINVFENVVYVCDYTDVLICINSNTGNPLRINVPVSDLEFLDNIEFSSEGEMFVCKRYFLEKLVEDDEGSWRSVKRIGPYIKGLSNTEYLSRPYSMFFEKSSQLLYVSDADRMMFVFDRDLNLVRYILNYEWDSNCGILINPHTQELFLCDSRRRRVLIYK